MRESKKLKPLLDTVGDNESVYAVQKSFQKNGKTCLTYWFIVGSEIEVWSMIESGCRTLCEVIDSRKPCHLYIDIDVDLKKTPSICARQCWEQVRPIISGHFNTMYGEGNHKYIVMDSSSKTKGSLHIVVKIKNRLFTSAAHCGAYMRVLHEFIKKEHPHLQGAFNFFDMGIYTRNRLFRMLNMTKCGQTRYLRCELDFNFENWKLTRVCPVNSEGVDLIQMFEFDGTEPRFGSGFGSETSTVVSGWVPPCVTTDIYKFLCNEYGNIPRMIYTGENMRVICNTENKNCMLARRTHKSNVMYIVINLINKSYHVKCHSRHCKNKRSAMQFFDDRLSNIIDEWMNMEVSSAPL
jgi:hypothetical protein